MNGKEAIEKVVKKVKSECCCGYRLIIMDINMPIMDGIEASKVIKSITYRNEIPQTIIIAASADPVKDEKREEFYIESGFVDYIAKSTTKAKFVYLLRKYKII
jgi:CheY-like chemotaxis protein